MHPSYLVRHLLLLTGLLLTMPLQAKPPSILVTIKPVHSLVSGLSLGISKPSLLIEGTQSPHDYALKPSDRRLLSEADLIIYTSPAIEGFMHTLENKLDKNKMIALSELPGIKTLPVRAQHVQGQNMDHDHHHHDSTIDGHIWLSIENAKIISQQLYQRLIKIDTENRETYAANLQRQLDELTSLQQQIKQQLAEVKNKPFMIYHDAFQYFEQEFGLRQSFFVTPSPEQQPGIKQVLYLRSIIQQNHLKCIFYEPPYVPGILKTITEDQQVKVLPLDPTGAQLTADDRLYFTLMHNIASQLKTCLSQ
ncbi:MAG TPA: zinc ABC transporter substrate-binding protein [Gammaproteobacteria bacterium]